MDKDIIIKDFTQRYILFLEASQQDITDKNYRVFGSGISASGRNVLFAIKGNF